MSLNMAAAVAAVGKGQGETEQPPAASRSGALGGREVSEHPRQPSSPSVRESPSPGSGG